MSKLTNSERDKLDNTCGNLRVTKLGTHVKSLEDFVNEGQLSTQADNVTAAINELYSMIVNNDCATIQIPPPGFFTLFGNDEDGKLYVYYNDEDHPPLFEHIETPGELEGTLYLYIADPQGDNHFEMEIGHYIAVRHLDNYYTKSQCDAKYPVTVEKQSTATSGYAATYVVKQNGSQVGTKIDIPKDFFLKGGSVKTCTTANNPVQGYAVGDKYLDMEINVQDGTATTKHMYILLRDLAPLYSADESTLTLSSNNVFSVKNGGISSVKIANGAVTTDKIASSAVTNDKINSVNGSKVIDSNAHSNIGSSANANQNAINTAIDTKISKLATKEQVDKIIAGDIDLTGYLKDDVGTVKSSNIADGTIVNGDIANTTITGGKLVNGTIAATQLASNAVETTKIKDGAVMTAKIGDSQVNNAKLSNNAVSTEKVSSIGAEKITNTRRLTTEDNLDNLTSTGRYYADATTMKTITNNVFQVGCIIEVVLWGTSSDIILQRMYRTNNNQSNNTIYYRIRHSSGWLDWQKISIDGHNHDSTYIKKTGGVSQHSNGNIIIPSASDATDINATGKIPFSGHLVSSVYSLEDFTTKLKSFMGGLKDKDNRWWEVISARQTNGAGSDGEKQGLLLKTRLEATGDLIWNKQYTGNWGTERTILDSSNYSNYANKITKTSQLTNDGDGTNVFVKNNDSRITNAVKSACKIGFSNSGTTPATSLEFSVSSGTNLYAIIRDANGNIPTNITKGYMVVNGSFQSKTVHAETGSIYAQMNVKATFLVEAGFMDANGWIVCSATCKVTVS